MVYYLLIIGRNRSDTVLLIDLEKKILSNVKYCCKGYFFWYQDFERFRQVVAHYLTYILMNANKQFANFLRTSFYRTPRDDSFWNSKFEYLFWQSFFVSLHRSILFLRRCLHENYLKFWYWCAEKYYPILHETFLNSCGFLLI